MATASQYRLYAEECLRWAEETDNEEHRQAFLDMAVAWLHLASRERTIPAPVLMPRAPDPPFAPK
jgi:hypothetical protein